MIQFDAVTIIIPHLGVDKQQEYSLDQCWISLRETVPDIKIIVATNGRQCLEHRHTSDVDIGDQGQCKAVNAAVQTTNTEWIFVTNDDMIYAPFWWQRLTSFYTTSLYKNILCVSPKLVEPRKGAPTFIVEPFGGAGGDFQKQKYLDYTDKKEKTDVLYVSGFNLPFLIRRDLWNTIGGYDVNYDPWGSNSDSDLEYKIKLAGIQPYQSQNSLVYHFSQTSGTSYPDNQGYWNKNWDYFIEKWGFPRTDNGIWEASFLIPTKEEGRRFLPKWEGKYKYNVRFETN